MTSTQYLAVDLGAESGRAMVGTLNGRQLSLEEVYRFVNGPVRLPDGLHWDVLRLWSEIKTGMGMAVKQTSGGLSSLGLDSWGVDFALLDQAGSLIGNPFHYRDSRTDGMLAEAFGMLPRAEIFAQTGVGCNQINTLYQLLAMVRAKAPALDAAATLLMIPDLFNYWLSGRAGCEFTEATTSECLDPRRKDWARPLLERFGIPTGIFPEIIMPGTRLGSLRAAVGEETGAGELPVIAPACHDTGSAVAAVPAEGKSFAWISSGTWSILGAEVTEPVLTAEAMRANFANEGGVGGTWRLSKNITGLWLVQECRRAWQREGRDFRYDALTQLAEAAAPFTAVVDVDSVDFLHPGDMPERIRAACRKSGQPVPSDEGTLVRCALESLALKYRWVLERLEAVTGTRLDPVHIIGGGTKNALLSQFTADATGRRVITGPVEATAVGNVLIQAVALGHLDTLADAREVVRCSFTPQIFEPSRQSDWDEPYARLLKVMEVL